MPGTRTRRHTATLLAAVYLVAGATGPALYYLAEAPRNAFARDKQRAADGRRVAGRLRGGFLHHHGDGLWHHHAWDPHDEAAPPLATGQQRSPARSRGAEPEIAPAAPQPHDHTCLLLAVTSAMEVSLRAEQATRGGDPPGLPVGASMRVEMDARSLASLGPRGPPPGRRAPSFWLYG